MKTTIGIGFTLSWLLGFYGGKLPIKSEKSGQKCTESENRFNRQNHGVKIIRKSLYKDPVTSQTCNKSTHEKI